MEGREQVYRPEDLIAIINRHRHDWMNDLQVLIGYVQMNRQDKIREYIARLSDKLTRESLVSKLADPNLVAYLHRFRAVCDWVGLEVAPEGEIDLTKLGPAGRRAAGGIPAVLEAFAESAIREEAEANRLTVAIGLDGRRLAVRFTCTGRCRMAQLHAALNPLLDSMRAEGAEVSLREEGGAADVLFRIATESAGTKGA